MPDIEEKIAKTEEEIRQLQNKKKKLPGEKKTAERKARTRRIPAGFCWKMKSECAARKEGCVWQSITAA